MIEQALMEYVANALWQIPMLVGGAWLLLAALKAGPRMQHGVWLAVLGLGSLLPLHGMGGIEQSSGQVGVRARSVDAMSMQETSEAVEVAPAAVEGSSPRSEGWLRDLPVRPRSVAVSVAAGRWVVGLYAGAVMLSFCRVVWAWRVARRMVERSREVSLAGGQTLVLEDYGRRLRIRLPQVRESVEVSSPMIVGVVAPVLLLPDGFSLHGAEEMRAALLHELAHVKRRDTLINTICQIVALPVSWHPVTQWVQGRIRRTREMVCDAMAAEEMRSQIGYARCLLALAKSMLAGRDFNERTAGVGLFNSNVLEERVMRLMETKTVMQVRTKVVRVASGAAAMMTTMAIAAMFHVTPTMAQQTGVDQHSAPVAAVAQSGSAEAAPSAEAVPAAAAVPAAVAAPAAVAVPAAAAPAARVSIASGNAAEIKGEKGKHVRRCEAPDGSVTIVNGENRELTAEERKKVEQEVADARKEVEKAMAKINTPEFRKQIENAQRQAKEATERINTPEFREQIENAKRQAMEAQKKINSPEFKEQMKKVCEQTVQVSEIEMPKIRVDLEKVLVQVDSAKFQRDMANLQKMVQSGEMQRNLEQSMQTMKEAQERMKDVLPK